MSGLTPVPCRKDNTSPTQKLFGHSIQDTLPAHRLSFTPEWQKNYLDTEQQATDTSQVKIVLKHSYPLTCRDSNWLSGSPAEPTKQTLGYNNSDYYWT